MLYYPLASFVALAALAALSAASPNGFRSYKSAPDGPSKLDDCGCWPIYQKMLTCQKLKGPNSGVEKCACIPNPDGWYTSMNGCRACLSPGSYDDHDFFDNLSRTISQLFVSCTEKGGGINADGQSICASNYYFRACASLGTGGQPSWASFKVFESGKGGNGTYVLDIAEYQANATTTGTAVSKTTTMSESKTTTETSATSGTSTTTTVGTSAPATGTSDAATRTAATSGPSTTTSPSSAMGYAESRSQAECMMMGLVMAVGIGAVLF
jgi:hypothetical protein